MGSHRKLALAILTVLISAWTVGPAAAAPLVKQRDRSDNTMRFQWDAEAGEMPTAYSSRLLRRNDLVDFVTFVAERAVDAPEGRRLRARATLTLNRDRAVRYRGRLVVLIEDSAGTIRKLKREVDFVLRPRKGERRKSLRWFFEVPSGDYTVLARFRHG